MLIEIKSWYTGAVLFQLEAGSLKVALAAAVGQRADLGGADLGGANLRDADLDAANLRAANLRAADLRGADLDAANLRGADLDAADLRGADLDAANLRGANLRGADLDAANLRGADLRDATLAGANLRGADLDAADLRGADLDYANLRGAKNIDTMRLETGETMLEFRTIVVPALLLAGGHSVPEQAWTCHEWTNCPMAAAFAVHKIDDIPVLYRPRVDQFVRWFDSGFIRKPEMVTV